MKKAEEKARLNQTAITNMDNKLKAHGQQLSHLKRMDNSQNQLIKMQKEQEIKLSEIKQELEDQRYSSDVKNKEREDIDSDFTREQVRLKSVTDHLDFQLHKL